MRRMYFTAVTLLAVVAQPETASAQTVNCNVIRENLCFATGCRNNPKSERLIVDLDTGSVQNCPSKYDDTTCIKSAMQFSILETSILGASPAGKDTFVRSIFLNRLTGSLTSAQLSSGGVAAISYGDCELRR